MSLLARLNKPWLHFIVLGWLLFELQRWAFPEPKPVIGPLSEARIETLRQQWLSAVGSPPSEEQLASAIARELDREMLFQQGLAMGLPESDPVVRLRMLRNMQFLQLAEGKSEDELFQQALAMRLHLGDEVVKRRLIQLMEQLMLTLNPPAPVSDQELQQAFVAREQELRRAPKYTIEQVFFSRDREPEVPAIVSAIQDRGLTPDQALEFSSPFLGGYRFNDQTPDLLARQFGSAFVSNFLQAAPAAQSWLGPIESTYGTHYVWVEKIDEARAAEFEEVRSRLERDLVSNHRAEALAQSMARLREQYEVRQ